MSNKINSMKSLNVCLDLGIVYTSQHAWLGSTRQHNSCVSLTIAVSLSLRDKMAMRKMGSDFRWVSDGCWSMNDIQIRPGVEGRRERKEKSRCRLKKFSVNSSCLFSQGQTCVRFRRFSTMENAGNI
ncbi:hypothetical protein TNCT_580041 [Trichonephila clavata]|uniref:Uncharacterized protein n=1 Tax=Trichonephila clavata TaxID=2740835 RepID=A0A8X6LLC7_TRICU|nr:hypothetical protein TNCT_580041 [Trichonephila clavata]